MSLATSLFLCAVLLSSFLLAVAEDFKPERTHLIDVGPPNRYLFRGNMPLINGSFAYKNITDVMRKLLTASNHSLPSNFTLIDISYDHPFEIPDYYTEREFMEGHPELGQYHNFIITGTPIVPPQDKPEEIQELLLSGVVFIDRMPHVLEKIHSLLTQQSGVPALLYSHCEAGTDRTGQMSGGYYLRYLNMTFQQALNIDNHIQGRDMYKTSRNELQWYCYHLYYKEGYTHLNCTLPN